MSANEKYKPQKISCISREIGRLIGKMTECDDNIRKFYLQTFYRKMESHNC